jgi:hypothetical protein
MDAINVETKAIIYKYDFIVHNTNKMVKHLSIINNR